VRRVVSVLLLPIAFCACIAVSFWYGRAHARSINAVGLGDVAVMVLPTIVIYLASLLLLWRRLKGWTAWNLAVFSLLVMVLAPAMIVVATWATYARGNSQMADYTFCYVIPFVSPVVAIYVSYEGIADWRRLRGRPTAPTG
jgi:hypothetical protein